MAKRNFGQAVKAAVASDPRSSRRTEDAPVGKWIGTCVFSDVKATNAGDKHRLILRFEVDAGPHTGKGGWNSQTLDPTSDISLRIFGKLCETLGVSNEELEQFDVDNPEDAPRVLQYVAEKAKGSRNEIVVVDSRQEGKVEIKYVNPLPKNAPPPQKSQAAAGMAQVAAATATSVKPAATGPKKPAAPKRPAL